MRPLHSRFVRYKDCSRGYAISGERTLYDFFERITPFEAAFMELFGRRYLSHRFRALVARLSDVDRPCLEPSRTLFQQHTFAERWTSETIGGIFTLSGAALHRL